MSKTVKLGLAALALSFGLASTQAGAADLPAWGGSMKDMPMAEEAAGCYVGVDAGYSWSNKPDVSYENTLGITFENRTYSDTGFVEFMAGCVITHGLRAEIAFAHRGDNDLVVIPQPNDPITTSVNSDTVMFNLYYDFGNWGGVMPYVGAGVGFALHDMENVIFQNAGLLGNNPQFGDEDYAFAWAVMAGIQAPITNAVSVDLGYRYIDMGSVSSDGLDNTGFVNPPLELDNLTAHEVKLGVRVQIGNIL